MKFNLSDLSTFEKLLNNLALDLREAWLHYKLFSSLNDSMSEYEREMSQSRAFWELTINSHLENSLFRLCRVYDQHKDSLNLKNILEAIKIKSDQIENHDADHEKNDSNLAFKNLDNIAKKQLESDLNFVSKEGDIVKKLVIWRNNKFAHQSAKKIIGKIDIFQEHSITYEELELLFSSGIEIINRYSNLLFNSSFSKNMVGQDDFQYVLDSVRKRLTPID